MSSKVFGRSHSNCWFVFTRYTTTVRDVKLYLVIAHVHRHDNSTVHFVFLVAAKAQHWRTALLYRMRAQVYVEPKSRISSLVMADSQRVCCLLVPVP